MGIAWIIVAEWSTGGLVCPLIWISGSATGQNGHRLSRDTLLIPIVRCLITWPRCAWAASYKTDVFLVCCLYIMIIMSYKSCDKSQISTVKVVLIVPITKPPPARSVRAVGDLRRRNVLLRGGRGLIMSTHRPLF